MNRYECDKCDWQYDWWRMGDRVKAVRRHELAHLVDQPAQPDSRMEVHGRATEEHGACVEERPVGEPHGTPASAI